jgi:lipopolysaccharide biosynthesis glycosyltransferase
MRIDRHVQSLFVFYTTMNDRLQMTLASAYSFILHSNFTGYRTSLHFFVFGGRIPNITRELSFLASVQPNISINVHVSNDPLLNAARNIRGLSIGHMPHPWVALTRLFVPFVYESDWYLYLDSDVLARGEFWPNVTKFIRDKRKVIFAVHDQGFGVSRRLKAYAKVASKGRIRGRDYFGSGVLVLRGGRQLKIQFAKAIRFAHENAATGRVKFIDQCALNFGCDREAIQLLPEEFCSVLPGDAPNGTVLLHWAGKPKAGAMRELSRVWDPAFERFLKARGT